MKQRAIAGIAVAGIALAAALMPAGARADAISDFYSGKTITIIVGTSAGGGYDTYARVMSRYMSKHLPGKPRFIVSNMPGAGSNIMAAHVANAGAKDGTVIAAPFSTQPLAGVLEDTSQLRYEPRKLNYLGSATTDIFLCVVRPDAAATTFADAFKHEVATGGTAERGSTGYLPVMLNNVLGTRFKPVFGYPGSREIMAAIEKGEVHGMCGLNWSSLNAQYSQMWKDGKIKIIVQDSAIGHPEMDKLGIPKTIDFAKTEEARRIMEIIYSQEVFARPFFVAHEVPADRLAALRKAFLATWQDPEVLAEMNKMMLSVDPRSGEEIQAMIERIYASPPDLLARTKEAIRLKR
jgi:tripartite-type tricarboxylate transporter receptor subunit TctC